VGQQPAVRVGALHHLPGSARAVGYTVAAMPPAADSVPPPKGIAAAERLIFPLDVAEFDQAKKLVGDLGDAVRFFKVGLELLLAEGGFNGRAAGLVDWLVERGKRVMVDLKIFDIARTVGAAVRQVGRREATFVTVHGNDEMLRAAAQEKGRVKILAVTVLTSLDRADVEELGFACDVESLVLSRARRALAVGCDGVVSSGLEAPALRRDLGERFLVVVPGVRPVENREIDYPDDQKRIVDLEEAFRNGADYVVVGRPIRRAPDPRAAAERIQERIARHFADGR
jgi:orotidine-5'-phosphate decarboxylase